MRPVAVPTTARRAGQTARQATIAASVAIAAACATSPHAPGSMLLPGAHALRVPNLVDSSADVAVFTQRPTGDTTTRLVAHVAMAALRSDDGIRLTTNWTPPFQSSDTLIVDARSLRPVSEVLAFNHVRYAYRYAGAHVTGTIQHPDSAPRVFDQTFDVPVFAFNEVKPLVRSLEYRSGAQMVVPLFSEVDGALERDTLTVLGRTRETGVDAWVVRFADPVITTRYLVDAHSRAILDAVTTQKKSGFRFHYAYATAKPRRAG
jgi:hypothetical protein